MSIRWWVFWRLLVQMWRQPQSNAASVHWHTLAIIFNRRCSFFFLQTELPNPQTMRQVWCWKTCTPAHCPKLCSLVEVNRAIKAWSYNWFFRKTGGNLPTQLSASPPAGWRDNASFGRFCWNPGQETHCDHNSRCQVVLEKIISSKI